MKLSQWAESQGIQYRTAWNMFRNGKLPVPAYQLPTGTIIVQDLALEGQTVAYCRVSGSGQKDDLDRQISRVAQAHPGIDRFVSEVASGMNDSRPKMLKLLSDPKVACIVVEHRDRLTRFGFNALEASLRAQGRKIIVLEEDEIEDDLVRDISDFMTSMCAKIYGRRSAKNRLAESVAEVFDD